MDDDNDGLIVKRAAAVGRPHGVGQRQALFIRQIIEKFAAGIESPVDRAGVGGAADDCASIHRQHCQQRRAVRFQAGRCSRCDYV